MDNAKIDYILGIFRTLSTEVPEQMLFREDGDNIELRTIEDTGSCLSLNLHDKGWKLVSGQMAEAV